MEHPMEPMDRLVAEFGNPYQVATRYHDGEVKYDELLATLGIWPYAPTTDADEDELATTASPGSFAHVEWALRHDLITVLDYRRVAVLAAEHYGHVNNVISVYELTLQDEGRWQINTKHSRHILDLDEGLVTRIPGPAAPPLPASHETYRLRTLDHCRARESGEWTMHPERGLSIHPRAVTTAISTILRIDSAGELVARS